LTISSSFMNWRTRAGAFCSALKPSSAFVLDWFCILTSSLGGGGSGISWTPTSRTRSLLPFAGPGIISGAWANALVRARAAAIQTMCFIGITFVYELDVFPARTLSILLILTMIVHELSRNTPMPNMMKIGN